MKTLLVAPLAILLGLGVSRPLVPRETQQYALTERVFAVEDHTSLKGAIVEAPALGIVTSSDSTGRFSLTVPAKGKVTISVRRIGFSAVTGSVVVPLARGSRLEVSLAEQKSDCHGSCQGVFRVVSPPKR